MIDQLFSGVAFLEALRDRRGKAINWEFKAVNPAFEQLMGLRADEVINRRLTEIVPEADAVWIEFCDRVVSGNFKAKFNRFFGRLGKWLEIVAYKISNGQIAVIISDITLRLEAQEKLRQSKESFRSLVGNVKSHPFPTSARLLYRK